MAFVSSATSDVGSLVSYAKKGEVLTWIPLYDVIAIPAIGGDVEQIETTTIYQKARSFINGRQNVDALEFQINASSDATSSTAHVKALDASGEEVEWRIEYGKTSASDTGVMVARWSGVVTFGIDEIGLDQAITSTFTVSNNGIEITIDGNPTPTAPGDFNPDGSAGI